ncbi:MAG: single-stranded-DNA-specific exonuclease RecJ [Deltaproteobacteria bacterium RIFOXYD12_FULL_56_24]|nr:MAG: single-stranded-DNA-specific exonuclease RecJ [Deltaproteobacteria bacterium RIFOXYD12_FULL_56_24]
MSAIEKIWEITPVDHERVSLLAAELDLPKPLAAILLRRGVETRVQAERFFSPSLADLPSPFLMQGMTAAVAVVLSALAKQSPVIIYGDYDVDGTTGAALLFLFLKKIGFLKVYVCQPHRLHDGYGLHLEAIRRTLPVDVLEQAPLVITVDCGISSQPQVRQLREMGCTVVVTDHHQPPEELPEAEAVLNPRQKGCGFPEKNLAGVGVAFYLAMGIRKALHEQGRYNSGLEMPNLKGYLDLVAVGTVADMVPITGINRILVKAGLEVFGGSVRPGLAELSQVSGIAGSVVTSEDIGFRLGPRLNAAGRMGDAGRALALLIAEDHGQARALAQELNCENELRKSVLETMCREAMLQAETAVKAGENGLIITGAGWHPGVIGIGAARMVEKFNRPTLFFTINDGLAKGSGRSVPGVNLYEILKEKDHLFAAFGGHEAAVGLTMPTENLPELEEYFQKRLGEIVTETMLAPKVAIAWDDEGGNIFTPAFLAMYEKLAPFGMGNPEPVFSAQGLAEKPREVGVNHLKFTARFNGAILDGIGFGLGGFQSIMGNGQPLRMAFRLRRNNFSSKTSWQVEAVDFKQLSV